MEPVAKYGPRPMPGPLHDLQHKKDFVLDNHLNFNYFYAMSNKYSYMGSKKADSAFNIFRPYCMGVCTDLFYGFWWWCNRCAMVRSL